MTAEAQDILATALEHERLGDTESALNAYLYALDTYPDDMEIAYRAATALLRANRLEEAVTHLRKIVFAEPDHIPARANLGNCQLLLGDHANAEVNFLEVLEVAPDNNNALYGLATVCLKQGKYTAALEPAERLKALLPENAPVLTLYGEIAGHLPQVTKAIAVLRKAISLDPGYSPALIALAQIDLRRKQFREAEELARDILQRQPESGTGLRLLASALLQQDHLSESYSILLKALSCDPENRYETLLQLCTVSRKKDDITSALLHSWQAYKLRPDCKQAGNALGSALAGLGHPLAARSLLTALARKTPLEPGLLDQIETICRTERQKQAAKPETPDQQVSTDEPEPN